jgi:hypothetical protein
MDKEPAHGRDETLIMKTSVGNPLLRRDFLRMAAGAILGWTGVLRGQSQVIPRVPLGLDTRTFDEQHQRREFEKSIDYLRRHTGAGKNRKRS